MVLGAPPADLLANPPSGWPEPGAQERIGRLTHIRERDAAACCAIGARGLGHLRKIADLAWHIWRSNSILKSSIITVIECLSGRCVLI